MHAPQIILIVLTAISGTITLMNHGKARENYNFFVWMIAAVLQLGLMYWGGFFG